MMTNTKENRKEKLISRIRALLEKTTDNGATENEMTAAIEKASQLMKQYDISQSEIDEVVEDEMVIEELKAKGRNEFMIWVISNLGKLCNVEALVHRKRSSTLQPNGKMKKSVDKYFKFYGEETDVILAVYLYNHIKTYIEKATNDFKRTSDYKNAYSKKQATNDFSFNLAYNISQRIEAMLARRVTESSSAYGLVLQNKLKKASDFMHQQVPNVRVSKGNSKVFRDKNAMNAGAAAANGINLNGGLSSAQKKTGRYIG